MNDKGEWKNNFPTKLDVEFESPLIKQSGFTPKDANSIKEIRKILNGALQKLLSFYSNKKDKDKFVQEEGKSKSQETIKTIAALFRLTNEVNNDDSMVIEVLEIIDKKTKKAKEDLALRISYPYVPKTRGIHLEEMEIARWDCSICSRRNGNNDYCQSCGFRREEDNKTVVHKEEAEQIAEVVQEPKKQG